MEALILIISLPFMVLNMLGGIVAGIWLAFLGEWSVIFHGIAFTVCGAFLCSIILLPGMLLSLPGVMLYEKEGLYRILSYPVLIAGFMWTYIAVSGWALSIFHYFTYAPGETSLLPLSAWAYGAAVGPWIFLAQKEQNEYSTITTFFLQIASMVMAIMIGFHLTSYAVAALIFLLIMSICFLFSLGLFLKITLSKAR